MNSIPNVNDIVQSWSIPMVAELITKTMQNRANIETFENIEFMGVPLMPITENSDRKVDGVRNWQEYELYCDYNFKIDDVIVLDNLKLRITEKTNWNKQGYYGFYKYKLKEDYE
jgi:hypothetical protein